MTRQEIRERRAWCRRRMIGKYRNIMQSRFNPTWIVYLALTCGGRAYRDDMRQAVANYRAELRRLDTLLEVTT